MVKTVRSPWKVVKDLFRQATSVGAHEKCVRAKVGKGRVQKFNVPNHRTHGPAAIAWRVLPPEDARQLFPKHDPALAVA